VSQVALVTGGAIRIGKALSLGLAEDGWDVVVHYGRSDAAAREVARQIEGLGQRAVAVQADIADPEAVEALARRVEEDFGRLDLLINSASSFEAKPLLEVTPDEWDRVMGVNLKGPFLTVRSLAPLLLAARGSVINLVDMGAFEVWAHRPHHAVSKAALLHLTRIMAKALAPRVRVNAIAPGPVLPPDDSPEELLESLRNATALGRLGSPEDVVRTALFLTRSTYITGEVIVVDGGKLLS
jgi:NAD(P)-dependent dehydrogenase (short-subunit alcohol dehydrogenase family)